MSTKGIFLSIVAGLLGIAYLIWFTDLFNKQSIQIIRQIRPAKESKIPRDPTTAPVYPVSFTFDGKYQFTRVKVVAADDLATNKYPHPLWHLISDSNSTPTKSIIYGENVPGMKPAVPRMQPEPLEPDKPYVLLVEAGKIKSQTNFSTRAVARALPQ